MKNIETHNKEHGKKEKKVYGETKKGATSSTLQTWSMDQVHC